jgi:hypothetical protein
VDKYEKPMKEFLNRSMRRHESGVTKKAEQFFKVFPKVTAMIATQLGENPFHLRGPLNVSALDSVMTVLVEEIAKIDSTLLKAKYHQLLEDKEFLRLIQINTTDVKTLQARIALVRETFLS